MRLLDNACGDVVWPERDIETQSYPLHLTMEATWAPVRLNLPFIVLLRGGDVVIVGQKTLRDKFGIDVMAQLKAYNMY